MMEHQELIFTNEVAKAIDNITANNRQAKVFVLTDTNTSRLVLPRLSQTSQSIANATTITISAGDINKNLESLSHIWEQLCNNGATRKSILINIGGGVITDIGGFAGATFKRGIKFINVPTTLLSAVDAAVGGKTGINFNGLKNEIGAFHEASSVIISTLFFDTLPQEELLSGYAEMLKHGLISDKDTYNRLLNFDITISNPEKLLTLLEESVNVKKRIVTEDPTEKGIRRALNLGHTAGHAFESMALQRMSPIPHGFAVAWGLVVELILSHLKLGFPSNELQRISTYIHTRYGAYAITCDDYPALLNFMHHDKKNENTTEINFTLLEDVGKIHIDRTCSEDGIKNAMDIYRDLMHI